MAQTRRPTPRGAVNRARAWALFRRAGDVTVASRPRVEGRLVLRNAGRMRLGSGFYARGLQFPIELCTGPGGSLTIGDRGFINQGSTIYAAESVTIGDHVRLADLVAIYDTDFHALDEASGVRTEPVEIGRNVWIGRGAMVLPGVTIGDHAVVAAGAIVSTPVPPRTLVAGIPARPVRELSMAADWVRA